MKKTIIDLSYKKPITKEPEEINIFHILFTIGFAGLLWLIFTQAFINGIY